MTSHDKLPDILAVDFDGTLCENRYPGFGEPNMDLINLIKLMQKTGSYIILWTTREGETLQAAIDWAAQFDLHFDNVNDNHPEVIKKWGSNPRKIFAQIYIDDMAYPYYNILGGFNADSEIKREDC